MNTNTMSEDNAGTNKGVENKEDELSQGQGTGHDRCNCKGDLERIIKEAVIEGINACSETEELEQPKPNQATYDKCFQECTYCGGWWDLENGPYIREKNVGFVVTSPRLGVRKICSRCLIGLFDHMIPRRTGIPGGLNNENGTYR